MRRKGDPIHSRIRILLWFGAAFLSRLPDGDGNSRLIWAARATGDERCCTATAALAVTKTGAKWQGTALIATGRIDTNTAPALRRELLRAFVDVDLVLSGVTFLSSPGLAALLAGQKHLVAHDCHLRLCDLPLEIRNVLEMVGFLDLFEIVNRSSMDDPYVAALMAMPFH